MFSTKIDFPLTRDEIQRLTAESYDALIELDKHGLIIGNNEDIDKFRQRLLAIESEITVLNMKLEENNHVILNGEIEVFATDYIDRDVLSKTAKFTEEQYNFSIDWAPGFYKQGLCLFFGGYTITLDGGLPVFIIKSKFKESGKWLWYRQEELFSHELCHTARAPINDQNFEEFFAYKLSPSKFRRYVGNCFQTGKDAIFILLPFLFLLVICMANFTLGWVIPEIYFWFLVFAYPIYLFIRNEICRKQYRLACMALKNTWGGDIAVDSILFRSNRDEIVQLGRLRKSKENILKFIEDLRKQKLRWEIIYIRFLNQKY